MPDMAQHSQHAAQQTIPATQSESSKVAEREGGLATDDDDAAMSDNEQDMAMGDSDHEQQQETTQAQQQLERDEQQPQKQFDIVGRRSLASRAPGNACADRTCVFTVRWRRLGPHRARRLGRRCVLARLVPLISSGLARSERS